MKSTVSVAGPIDRELEVRIGPRVSFLTGDVRAGRNGTVFDIWDDLKLDSPNGGIQFDADWQPVDRWHFTLGLTWDHFDQSGVTSKAISNGGTGAGGTLAAGSTIKADLDLYTFEGSVGYDLVKNNTLRVRPYVGGKGYYGHGTISRTSAGTGAFRAFGGEQGFGSYLLGVDTRVYASRDWYIGGDIGASAWSNYYNLTGDAYTGYDFSKTWGVRLGYAYDHVNYENSNKTTQAEPLLGAVYVQAIWGF